MCGMLGPMAWAFCLIWPLLWSRTRRICKHETIIAWIVHLKSSCALLRAILSTILPTIYTCVDLEHERKLTKESLHPYPRKVAVGPPFSHVANSTIRCAPTSGVAPSGLWSFSFVLTSPGHATLTKPPSPSSNLA
jgi:hypothetical protein